MHSPAVTRTESAGCMRDRRATGICLIIRRAREELVLSSLVEASGLRAEEVDGEACDDRDIFALLEDEPFAIVLPLSLPRFASVRIAELIALRRLRTRLILVTGSDAPVGLLQELFDLHLPRRGDGLVAALRQKSWVHAFQRRRQPLDTAIQAILQHASCFWPNGPHDPQAFASLVDYQSAIAESARHFRLLFLVSDPSDSARLRLMREAAEIENELSRRSSYSFTVRHAFSSRPDEVMRRLLEERPHIVHFSGHGDSSGRLCFEDATGRSWPADQATIAAMCEASRRYLRCAVLNTCFSAEQARLISAHIEYAIGLTSSVSDDAAIALAKGFYGALSVTGRISQAIGAARTNLQLLSGGSVELQCLQRAMALVRSQSA